MIGSQPIVLMLCCDSCSRNSNRRQRLQTTRTVTS